MIPHLKHARAAVLVTVLACGGSSPAPGAAPAPTGALVTSSAGALSRFAGLRVMVLPTQGVVAADTLRWRTAGGGDKALLAALDPALADSVGARGLSSLWIFPPALARSASRNPTYITDPGAMRALDAVRVALRKRDEPLAEPFASQLRALAGVSDARYALVPLELRFESIPTGASGRAALRLALVDARGAQLVWVGEVFSDPAPQFAPGVLASLAQRVADLVVSR